MDPYSQTIQLIDSGRPFCVVVVLSAEGSTPREAGVRAAVTDDGRIQGTIGGGAVEAEAQRRAVEACAARQAVVFEAELAGEAAAGHEPICGGTMRVLVDPSAAKDRAAYCCAAEALAERGRGVLLTSVRTGAEPVIEVEWVPEAEVAALPDAAAVRGCLADGEARLLGGSGLQSRGGLEVLVEPVVPQPLLVIAGGGHIGQALAMQALLVGFDALVIDDRPEFTDPALFPEGVETRCGPMAETVAATPAAKDTYIVIVTRGHQHDVAVLRACLGQPAAYVGMIGSHRKVALVREGLVDAGVATVEELEAIHAPIGLDIGAETVPEIAASIVAQLIAVRRQGRGDRRPRDMRDR